MEVEDIVQHESGKYDFKDVQNEWKNGYVFRNALHYIARRPLYTVPFNQSYDDRHDMSANYWREKLRNGVLG